MPETYGGRPVAAGLVPASRRRLARLRYRLKDQRGSQITDNLGLIVMGIVAVLAIGTLISGLDSTIFTWVTTKLGLS